MAPKKWDKEAECDLLMAIRVAENGYNPVTRETWNKATQLMNMMGYPDATWTGISQRWSKFTQKSFQNKYPQALAVAEGNSQPGPATTGSGSGPAAAPARRARGTRPQKREHEEEEEDQEEAEEEAKEEVVVPKKARVAKKQKKN